MYIFQPDRFLLVKQIKELSHYIKGKVLDIGAGEYNRYGRLFNCQEYIKMDVCKSDNVDIVGSIEKIPFPDNCFDSVVSTQVFEHIKNPFLAVKEVSRILKPRGHCLITVPQTNELHSTPDDFWRYTNFGIINIFRGANFSVVEIKQRGAFFSNIDQILTRYAIDRLKLYKHPVLGKIANVLFVVFGKLAIFLDNLDKSEANKKHAIGWCAVFKNTKD